MYLYICIHIYMHIFICISICICMYRFTYICKQHLHVTILQYAICDCTHTDTPYIYTGVRIHICSRIMVCLHVYQCMYLKG